MEETRRRMPTQFQPSSFIPKEPISSGKKKSSSRKKGPINLFMVIALTLFIAVLIGAVGVFVYERATLARIESKRTQLSNVQESLNKELIQELVRFDTRIDEGEKLIQNHIAVSPFFHLLEERTLRSVRFTSLQFGQVEDSDKYQVSLSGVTSNYTNVAVQLDEFGSSNAFRNPIVSNFGLNDQGDVTFTVTMDIDRSLISYVENLNN
ncbi:MAG: hypothetical protein WDZ70_01730 [Candidatus Paceibacterota bacterium]